MRHRIRQLILPVGCQWCREALASAVETARRVNECTQGALGVLATNHVQPKHLMDRKLWEFDKLPTNSYHGGEGDNPRVFTV